MKKAIPELNGSHPGFAADRRSVRRPSTPGGTAGSPFGSIWRASRTHAAHASERFDRVMTSIRNFYSSNVVNRLLARKDRSRW